MGGNRQQLAERLKRAEAALRDAQRELDGSEGARMRYLAARVEHAEVERDTVEVLLCAAEQQENVSLPLQGGTPLSLFRGLEEPTG